MRAAISKLTDSEIKQALDYLITLPALTHPTTLTGNAEKGRALYRENCMACHRFNAGGEVVFKSAPLAGLQDWYLLAQTEKFLKGIRGYHPKDEQGAKMRENLNLLTTRQELLDILAHIATLKKKSGKK